MLQHGNFKYYCRDKFFRVQQSKQKPTKTQIYYMFIYYGNSAGTKMTEFFYSYFNKPAQRSQ